MSSSDTQIWGVITRKYYIIEVINTFVSPNPNPMKYTTVPYSASLDIKAKNNIQKPLNIHHFYDQVTWMNTAFTY